ncbi:hypothetical protein [Legionella feeleii]|uniref:hypothetical protein n=1 Tax=Legionella feeleii TaxID=453 RepID=UPI001558B36E|nr:hypothetical protein [Legionella feeleii]
MISCHSAILRMYFDLLMNGADIHQFLTHIQPRYGKVYVDENSLNAVIIAQAIQ